MERVNGTLKEVQVFGLFHQWGTEVVEDTNTMCQYTVGIVEKADGQIITPEAQYVQFLPDDFSMPEWEDRNV